MKHVPSLKVNRLIASVVTSVALGSILTGCSFLPMPVPTPTPTPTASGDGVLRIGDMTPLTGPLALSGAAQAAGIELAAREINDQGGVMDAPIEVWHRDAGDGDPAKTTANFETLVAHKVDVIIAPASDAVMDVLLPLAKAAGILVVAPATQATAPAGASVTPIVPDDGFAAQLLTSDPSLSDFTYGAESYELTTALALAATFLHDDGAVSLSWALSHVQGPGIPCTSYGACRSVLATEPAIAYAGPAGAFHYDVASGTVAFGDISTATASPSGKSTNSPTPTNSAKK